MTSVTLAAKFLDDRVFSQKHYARVGGIPSVTELTRMEVTFFHFVDYGLHVTDTSYSKMLNKLLSMKSARDMADSSHIMAAFSPSRSGSSSGKVGSLNGRFRDSVLRLGDREGPAPFSYLDRCVGDALDGRNEDQGVSWGEVSKQTSEPDSRTDPRSPECETYAEPSTCASETHSDETPPTEPLVVEIMPNPADTSAGVDAEPRTQMQWEMNCGDDDHSVGDSEISCVKGVQDDEFSLEEMKPCEVHGNDECVCECPPSLNSARDIRLTACSEEGERVRRSEGRKRGPRGCGSAFIRRQIRRTVGSIAPISSALSQLDD